MHNNAIDIPANPLSSGAPVAGDLAATTGESQGTVAAMLNAQIREEQTNRMMNPSAYGNVSEPYDVVKAAAVIGIATITAATVGKIWHNPKDKKSESDAGTNSGFEDSAE